jgi:hypothetical protein
LTEIHLASIVFVISIITTVIVCFVVAFNAKFNDQGANVDDLGQTQTPLLP